MNTSLVKTAPAGYFADVSVLMQGWETKFQMLVSQKQPIKLDIYPQPDLLAQVSDRLKQQGYHDLILERDRWQHFLVPAAN